MKKIFIASDHGGLRLKEQLKKYLAAKSFTVQDLGPKILKPTDDYPDYAYPLAKKVAASAGRGILVCRNGIGVCIVANKVAGIRAVSTSTPSIAKTARVDDDTNILCLGQDFTSFEQAKKIVDVWLVTPFSGSVRHRRRLRKLSLLEKKK